MTTSHTNNLKPSPAERKWFAGSGSELRVRTAAGSVISRVLTGDCEQGELE